MAHRDDKIEQMRIASTHVCGPVTKLAFSWVESSLELAAVDVLETELELEE
jgi:hypothetical protein